IMDFGSDGAIRMVIGEVLAIHVREDALDGTRIKSEVIDAIGRMAGNSYIFSRDRFEIQRPS
ncbi:MAG: flavin reductase family protein, partial [Actinobacteria bacterium]|nr:flavin reductase family protein [Actinomycetota bacterium]